jgi:DNA repair exonuclease SbcCD nuclease subunit
MKTPSAILTADWHIREDKPKCRTDADWMLSQQAKIEWIRDFKNELETENGHPIPILHAGDLFNTWRTSPWLISYTLRILPELIVVPGNHDAPYHSLDRLHLSALNVLNEAQRIFIFPHQMEMRPTNCDFRIVGFPFGEKLKPNALKSSSHRQIALIHHFVYKGRKPFPGATGGVNSVMKKLKGFDLIVSGDNHKPFTHRNKEGQLLVNPGSLMRQTADQMDHKPRVYVWYAEDNTVEPFIIPFEKGVVSREHIEKENERNDRITAYVERLNEDVDLGLNFQDNLEEYIRRNYISKAVQTKIYEAVDE